MRTPDGRECPYYYGGYYRRAAEKAVCHLLDGQPDARRWTPALCATCVVPDIRRANGCAALVLHAHIGGGGWRFWEGNRMRIHATCTRSKAVVPNPYTGCGLCHENITFVVGAESGAETSTG